MCVLCVCVYVCVCVCVCVLVSPAALCALDARASFAVVLAACARSVCEMRLIASSRLFGGCARRC